MGRQSDALESHDDNSPPSGPVQSTPAPGPKMVLPPPAPQTEQEGLQAGGRYQVTPDPVQRLHGDSTRNPINKQWTRSPTPRSR